MPTALKEIDITFKRDLAQFSLKSCIQRLISIQCKKVIFEVTKISKIKLPMVFRRSILFVFQQLIDRATVGAQALSDQVAKDLDA